MSFKKSDKLLHQEELECNGNETVTINDGYKNYLIELNINDSEYNTQDHTKWVGDLKQSGTIQFKVVWND